MIELFDQQIRTIDRHSSKGNQLKWENNGIWYKADYMGYEGLAEYIVSHLLEYSTLKRDEYVIYDLDQIKYKRQIFNGVKSLNMLSQDWQIITVERLFFNRYGKSFYESIWKIKDVKSRLEFLVDSVIKMTGLEGFGVYIEKLLTLDALFKNEDRHMHNIAVLMNGKGEFDLCPIFDNGASLLSDYKMDYPLTEDIYDLMEEAKAKTVSQSFDEQLDIAEQLYGVNVRFNFNKKIVDELLENTSIYSDREIERVREFLYQQMRKYKYLFINN